MSEHYCHAIGCKVAVPPERLFCLLHWYSTPMPLRARVWATYQNGQCDGYPPPSEAWHQAADAAISFVAMREIKLLVMDFFKGDEAKTNLWFKTRNPLLGELVPEDMAAIGVHYVEKLHRFVFSQLAENPPEVST